MAAMQPLPAGGEGLAVDAVLDVVIGGDAFQGDLDADVSLDVAQFSHIQNVFKELGVGPMADDDEDAVASEVPVFAGLEAPQRVAGDRPPCRSPWVSATMTSPMKSIPRAVVSIPKTLR